MISSISFRKLLREDLKKRIWLLGFCAAIFLVVLPIATAMRIDNALYWAETEVMYVKKWFIESELGNSWAGLFIVLGATLGAITSSLYLHSRRQLDFYHSLPVKREQWFIVSYVSSFIQVMVPCLISLAVRYLIGVIKGVTSENSFEALGVTIGVSLIAYHVVYMVSVIGMVLTGKMLTGILMIGFLQFWYPFVLALKNTALGMIFETYLPSDGIGGYDSFLYSLKGQTQKESPVFLYFHMIEMYLKKESVKQIVLYFILLGVALLAVALLLYKKRPAEAAGKAIAFPVLEPVVKVIFAMTVGVFFSVMSFQQYNVMNGNMPAWTLLIGMLAASAACCAVEFLYSTDFRMVWKKKKSFGIAVLGTLGISAVIQFDLIGYDTYIPPLEKVVSMSVDLSYKNSDVFDTSLAYGEVDNRSRLNKLRTTDFARIYKLAKNGVSHVGERPDQRENTEYISVEMAYYLQSGKAVYRRYYVDYEELYQCMDSLLADRDYRKDYFDIDQLEKGTFDLKSVNMYFGTSHKLSFSKEKLDKLLKTYVEELETKPFSVFENANLVAKLHFENEDAFMDFPIYQEFTDTLEILKQELKGWRSLDVEDIGSMTVEYIVEEDEGTGVIRKTVKPEEMQQVLDSMCYVQTGFLGNIAEEDMYIMIDTTMGQTYSYYIRKGQVPEFLKLGS